MKENIYIITLIQIKMKYFYYFSLSNVRTRLTFDAISDTRHRKETRPFP